MEFPRRRWLWIVLFCLMGGPVLLLGLPVVLWTFTLPPVERAYLPSYALSTFGETSPHGMTPIRWIMKTGPKRQPVTLLPGDAVTDIHAKNQIALSPAAKAEGWTGILIQPPRQVRSSELAAHLKGMIYDGDELWWLLTKPMLYLLASVAAIWTLRRYFRSGSKANGAHEERHGRRTKGPELQTRGFLGRSPGDGIRLEMQGASRLFPGGSYRIPKRLEASHILLMGDTGSGKSSAIRQILRQVQERGESAIVYDPATDFISEFYDPARGDLILNPLDARCPWWDLPGELSNVDVATTIAAAMLPEKEYEKSFFTDAPRRVLARLLLQRPTVQQLIHRMSDPEEITSRMQGTPQAAMVDPGAPAQRAGVLSSLNLIADSLELLPGREEGRDVFSAADWQFKRTRWVFLTSSAANREKLLPLHSVWLDLLILRMMEPCVNEGAKPVWFVLDELASLNKLPKLHEAVTENRKYGNPVVMGLQGRSQMEKRYGQDAEAMLSQPATKIFLKTSEPRAAKWVSEAIGEIEVERLKESRSMKLLGSRRSYAMEIATKPLIMASEIAGLAPLHGYIKQENQVVPAHFRLAKKREGQPAFVARKLQKEAFPALDSEVVSASVPVLPKTSMPSLPQIGNNAAVQTPLPLSPVQEGKKDGFTWSSRHEIE